MELRLTAEVMLDVPAGPLIITISFFAEELDAPPPIAATVA
jgi:hypothetical protein